jgi:hypothetical protein
VSLTAQLTRLRQLVLKIIPREARPALKQLTALTGLEEIDLGVQPRPLNPKWGGSWMPGIEWIELQNKVWVGHYMPVGSLTVMMHPQLLPGLRMPQTCQDHPVSMHEPLLLLA